MNTVFSGSKRFFAVPCSLADNYLKLADGPALKLILYLLSSEEEFSAERFMAAAGVSKQQLSEALMFWKQVGVISDEDHREESGSAIPMTEIKAPEEPRSQDPAKMVVHSRYQPKDIAEMLRSDRSLKELFSEAEATLGRILKHADHEVLLNLRDYYGFDEQSVVLILEYCARLGKTSARYYETVAKDLFEKGAGDFKSIEEEFARRSEASDFESEIKREFGIDVKLSAKQSGYIKAWKEMGFGTDMISIAREKCVDATNKISFPYINKVLSSWKEKGITTPEAAMNEKKPDVKGKESSFDLDEFDRFTLGEGKENK